MSDIIETIDGALRDFEVSGDAMRWTPEPPEPAPRQRLARGGVLMVPDVADPSAPTADEISRAVPIDVVEVVLEIDTSRFVEAMRRAAEALTAMAPKIEALTRPLRQAATRMQEREAARQHQPVPLSIDGHAYRRRTRRRRR